MFNAGLIIMLILLTNVYCDDIAVINLCNILISVMLINSLMNFDMSTITLYVGVIDLCYDIRC